MFARRQHQCLGLCRLAKMTMVDAMIVLTQTAQLFSTAAAAAQHYVIWIALGLKLATYSNGVPKISTIGLDRILFSDSSLSFPFLSHRISLFPFASHPLSRSTLIQVGI